jgi:HAD superfamily hydrolase (TIGR01509 family)
MIALSRPDSAAWRTPLRAVVFDMDGVLVDSEPIHRAAAEEMLRDAGHVLTDEMYVRCIGTTVEATWDIIEEETGLDWGLEEFKARYEGYILAELSRPLERLPGVDRVLGLVEQRGLGLALATSSRRSWLDATLGGLGLTGRFPVTVTGDEVEHGKPDPDIFLLAARRLGVEPHACLAIEDSPPGVAAAHAAGMRSVAVRTEATRGLSLDGADVILESLEEFPEDFLD